MRKIKYILLYLFINIVFINLITNIWYNDENNRVSILKKSNIIQFSYAYDGWDNIRIDVIEGWKKRLDTIDKIYENNSNLFISRNDWWNKWIQWLLFNIARDLRVIVFVILAIIWIILVIKLFFWNNTEEEAKKLKTWILWASIWIIVMQIAFSTYYILYDKDIWDNLSKNLYDGLIVNFINLLKYLAAFIFIAMMIYSFYRIITAWWDEEKAKKWKITVLQALAWFIVIKVSDILVRNTYEAWCRWWDNLFWWSYICQDIKSNANIISNIINWLNSFIFIIVVILVVYAWFLIMISNGEQEKTNKAKKMIIYIALWLVLLFANYIILTFFMSREAWLSNINL